MATIPAPIERRTVKLAGSFKNGQMLPSMARPSGLKTPSLLRFSAGRNGFALRAR
jgi:hypothetical protein